MFDTTGSEHNKVLLIHSKTNALSHYSFTTSSVCQWSIREHPGNQKLRFIAQKGS